MSIPRRVLLYGAVATSVIAAMLLVHEFCLDLTRIPLFPLPPRDTCPPYSVCLTYLLLVWPLAALMVIRYLVHDKRVLKARLEDPGVVEALFVEADTVRERTTEGSKWPRNFDEKVDELQAEKKRLVDIGRRGWTEYRLLALNQMLVEFLDVHELKARARTTLAELQEYADDSAYRYDTEQFYRWQESVGQAIGNIEKDEGDNIGKAEQSAQRLRAELAALLDHIADYHMKWAEGSVILRSLTLIEVVAIPTLLTMALLPILHPCACSLEPASAIWPCSATGVLQLFHWGLLGAAGSTTAALLGLRRSNVVEVGNTEGRKELWSTVTGAVLGLVAGILVYSALAGGIITDGSAVPAVASGDPKNIALSILWALGAGFSFERIFDRLRVSATGINA